MPFDSLGEFLAELQDHGELARIAAPVDSALELAAITDRIARSSPSGGPALLFENVKNSPIPVVTNLLGSRERLCRCLGVSTLDEVSTLLDQRLPANQSNGWLESLKLAPAWGGLSKWHPKLVKTAACQQVVRLGRDVNLWDWPIPRSWPDETYPVVTSGEIVVNHPETGIVHCFRSPVAVLGPLELAWYIDRFDLESAGKTAIASGQNLPVAISLGGDPLLTLSTALPTVVDTRLFAGLLRGSSLELVRCRTNELEVPASSEIIIEGYVDAQKSLTTEPIAIARGNGRYVRRHLTLIQVTAVTHRANPVLPAVITAAPSSEESWISLAAERLMLPILKRNLPEIVDIHQPFCGAGRNLLFVSIRKTVDHQARRVLHALWGMESLGQTKLIVIVDADQNVQSEQQVWFTVGTNSCPGRDFLFSDCHARSDDYTLLSPSLASRVGIDATRKSASENSEAWAQTLEMSAEIIARVNDGWAGYGFPIE